MTMVLYFALLIAISFVIAPLQAFIIQPSHRRLFCIPQKVNDARRRTQSIYQYCDGSANSRRRMMNNEDNDSKDSLLSPSDSENGNIANEDDSAINQEQIQLGAWIPVGSASSFQTLTPLSIEIMGHQFVVWDSDSDEFSSDQEAIKKKNKQWAVMMDECPHRLAPLSQGRINPNSGCIECPYHGWQFDADGGVTCIPQLGDDDYNNKKKSSLSATSFPVHLTGDLIWVFLPTRMHGEMFPIDLLPEQKYYPSLQDDIDRKATYYSHVLTQSFHLAVENGLDPAHFPFAHHGVISERKDAQSIPMRVHLSNSTHLNIEASYVRNGQYRERLYGFQRPSLLYTQEKRQRLSTSNESNITYEWHPEAKFFIVPVRDGQSRIITSVAKLTKSWVPDWVTHWATGRLFEGDSILHQAEYRLVLGGSKYKEPTLSDNGGRAWSKWRTRYTNWNNDPNMMNTKHIGNALLPPPHTFGIARRENLLSRPLPPAKICDPWMTHVSTCSKCRRVLKRARILQFWSGALGFACGWWNALQQKPLRASVMVTFGLLISYISKKLANHLEGFNNGVSGHAGKTRDRSISMYK